MRLKLAVMLLAGFWALLGPVQALAQVGYELQFESKEPVSVTGKDTARGKNALILYTPEYGLTTRTNAFGVEAVAVKTTDKTSSPDITPYKVTRIVSVWDCQKMANTANQTCGNVAIPENGIVLSASDDQRQALLNNLHEGDTFQLKDRWFQSRAVHLNVINPSILNNPQGSAFPGFRAGNQMILYNAGYGQPTTGTNEFGFEVTVLDGMVVAQEGSDSKIPENIAAPTPENSAGQAFVLSGHGAARDWLIANAPIGAKITVSDDQKTITSTVDIWTYRYQLLRTLEDAECRPQVITCQRVSEADEKIKKLQEAGQLVEAARTAQTALDQLHKDLWFEYRAFPVTATKGAWHRPTELTREAIGGTLDYLKQGGLNAVFLETFFHGYTIFPSQTYEVYGLEKQNPKFRPAGDLLSLWLEEAHKRNMKVHVWFQTFYAGNKQVYEQGQPIEGPILSKYPQWANVQFSALDKDGESKKPMPSTLETGAYFLDPANPEVQAFLLSLIKEIVSRYPVDGFQLDYIRYPASFPPDRYSYQKTTWGYTTSGQQGFQNYLGVSNVDVKEITPKTDPEVWEAWNSFKQQQVTEFVHKASDLIREENLQKRQKQARLNPPNIQISAAVFPKIEDSKVRKHQDWQTWAVNGWVDFLAPMTLTSATKVVQEDTREMIEKTQGKVPVVSGIFGPFNNNTAEQVLTQVEAARSGGASGMALFDTAHLTGRMVQALRASQVESTSKAN